MKVGLTSSRCSWGWILMISNGGPCETVKRRCSSTCPVTSSFSAVHGQIALVCLYRHCNGPTKETAMYIFQARRRRCAQTSNTRANEPSHCCNRWIYVTVVPLADEVPTDGFLYYNHTAHDVAQREKCRVVDGRTRRTLRRTRCTASAASIDNSARFSLIMAR